MSLTTDRFYLEEMSEDKHVQDVHSLWSNPNNLVGSDFSPVTSIEDNRNWLRKRSRASNPAIENFVIVCPTTSPLYPSPPSAPHGGDDPASASSHSQKRPVVIGFVGILRTEPPELGYLIARPFWGTGVASEAIAVCMRYYWHAQPSVGEVFAFINEGHGASEKVAARNGFVKDAEATVKAGGKLPNGTEVDQNVGIWVLKRPTMSVDDWRKFITTRQRQAAQKP